IGEGDAISLRTRSGGYCGATDIAREWATVDLSGARLYSVSGFYTASPEGLRMPRIAVLLVCSLIGATGFAQRQTVNPQKPNVVLIMTDDVGYGDFGSYGAPDIRTPNIDGLAKEGVRFTDFYANGPVCTPTRTGLITGRYQQRVKFERALGARDREAVLPLTGRSLPRLLKNNGYATALIGKWHLGWNPEFGPNAHGFDYFFGFLSGSTDYYMHVRPDGLPDLFENGTPVEEPGYMTDLITAHSVRFVEQNAARPFFLEVAYNAAHWPFQRPDHSSAASRNPSSQGPNAFFQGPDDSPPATRADYAAMLERADQGVGQILKALEDRGLTRNTLVIFTNDNGGEWLSRNAPLFHRKDTLWEGGVRVPAILRWPGRLPAGRTTAQVGITMDLTASILAATNTPVPADARLEGVNLFPILRGESPSRERTLFWRINAPERQQLAVRSGNSKLLVDGDQLLLFDLQRDIGEKTDLAANRPELVRELRDRIQGWERDVDREAATLSGGQP
ncbi:MAG: sulfatase-like hydrolase/transferase, partial [Terriglobia bacterium]